jgi:hypothetical protein
MSSVVATHRVSGKSNTRRVPQMEQELHTILENLSSSRFLIELVLPGLLHSALYIIGCPISFSHCHVCPSINDLWCVECCSSLFIRFLLVIVCVVCPSIYGCWLPLWYLQTFFIKLTISWTNLTSNKWNY